MGFSISNIQDRLRRFVSYLFQLFPLTYSDIICRQLDKDTKDILDIGCGRSYVMKIVRLHLRLYSVGLDLFLPYMKEAKTKLTHNDYVHADARHLPFRPKSFDTILCSQVIEHLSKEDAIKLLKEIDEIATKQIVLATPIGSSISPADANKNSLQKHLSCWVPLELMSYGYHKIKGQGLRLVYGEKGIINRIPKHLRPIFYLISYFMAPLTYFVPSMALHMICVKFMDHKCKL